MTFSGVQKMCFSPFHTNLTSGQGHKRRCREFWASGVFESSKPIHNHKPLQEHFSPFRWIQRALDNLMQKGQDLQAFWDGVPNQFLLTYASCLVCLFLCQSVSPGCSWPWHLALNASWSDRLTCVHLAKQVFSCVGSYMLSKQPPQLSLIVIRSKWDFFQQKTIHDCFMYQ